MGVWLHALCCCTSISATCCYLSYHGCWQAANAATQLAASLRWSTYLCEGCNVRRHSPAPGWSGWRQSLPNEPAAWGQQRRRRCRRESSRPPKLEEKNIQGSTLAPSFSREVRKPHFFKYSLSKFSLQFTVLTLMKEDGHGGLFFFFSYLASELVLGSSGSRESSLQGELKKTNKKTAIAS